MSSLMKCPHCENEVVPNSHGICPCCRKDTNDEELVRESAKMNEIKNVILNQYETGAKRDNIVSLLEAQGFSTEDIEKAFEEVKDKLSGRLFENTTKLIDFGVVSVVVGLLIAVGSYMMSSKIGGLMIISYGAIGTGLAEIALGVWYKSKAKRSLG